MTQLSNVFKLENPFKLAYAFKKRSVYLFFFPHCLAVANEAADTTYE